MRRSTWLSSIQLLWCNSPTAAVLVSLKAPLQTTVLSAISLLLATITVCSWRHSHETRKIRRPSDATLCGRPPRYLHTYSACLFSSLSRNQVRPLLSQICTIFSLFFFLQLFVCSYELVQDGIRHFLKVLTAGKLYLRPFELKIGTSVTPALGNVHTNFGFSAPFRFQVRNPYSGQPGQEQ